MFYKLIDENTIQKAPKPLIIDGKNVFTNSEKVLNENGYYRVVFEQKPEIEDEVQYIHRYELRDNTIYRVWAVVETIEENITFIEDITLI